MILHQWAAKWRIPHAALHELLDEFGMHGATAPVALGKGTSEATVASIVKMEACKRGVRLWRNNVGGTYTPDGGFLRYGLANESKALNDVIKSADLIGIRPILIRREHEGMIVGQFVSRETKPAGWRYTGAGREPAQLAWVQVITSYGGDAAFAAGEGTL